MSQSTSDDGFVSRGGAKLSFALDHFRINVTDLVCADLGSHVGGFVDCLLRAGAKKVFSVDTSYGTLAWKLRKDDRVVVLERRNAMHVTIPEKIDLVTADVGWTRQEKFLPNVATMLGFGGRVLTLIKPHYEADKACLCDGVLPDEEVERVVSNVLEGAGSNGWSVLSTGASPIRGHGGNREVFALLARVG